MFYAEDFGIEPNLSPPFPNLLSVPHLPTLLASLSWQPEAQNWILGAWGVLLVLLIWAYRGKPAPIATRFLCTMLKLVALGLLLVCILEPRWKRRTVLPRANTVAIVLDNSDSLNIPAGTKEETRLQTLHSALQTADSLNGWIPTLETQFQIQRFTLGEQLTPISSFTEDLPKTSQTTPLSDALRNLKNRFSQNPLAAVILLTDGQASTTLLDADLEEFPPIFPIPASQAATPPDLALKDIQITHSQFEDAPITIQAQVKAQHFDNRSITVKLLDPEGETLEKTTQVLNPENPSPQIRFQFNPKTTGLAFYTLTIAEEPAPDQTPIKEATFANNNTVLAIQQPTQPFRVLYLSGRPNWEYKFLRRALHQEDKLHLVGLIRVAKKEARFEFRGRTGESSNPLFRGFKDENAKEEEQYDEAVLIRLNTRDKDELLNGFPTTAEELYPYHAVILDDIESSFFTREQHSLLEKYVSQRGGGLLLLGGLEMFQDGGYPKTPIGNLLPLYLSQPSNQAQLAEAQENRLQLTREGWLTPWLRLRSTEIEEKAVQSQMPAFLVHNQTNGLKPGATLLAILAQATPNTQAPLPALSEHRLGNGRVMALTVGDLWRWAMKDPETQPEQQKFWRQSLRHLLADVPEPTTLKIEQSPDPGNPLVQIQLTARNPAFTPLDNSETQLQLTSPDGQQLTLPSEPSANLPATWNTQYRAMATGAYTIEAKVLESDGKTLITKAQAGWATNPANHEHRDHSVDKAFLENLAQKTGGTVYELGQLEELAGKLPKLQAPIMHEWVKPLWHNPWVLSLILALLAAEWLIRRKNNLA